MRQDFYPFDHLHYKSTQKSVNFAIFTKRHWHMRLDGLSAIGMSRLDALRPLAYALRASKHHWYMRLEHLSAIGICA